MKHLMLTGLLLVAAVPHAGRAEDAGAETNVIAVAFGEKITADRKADLSGIIFGGLLRRYAAEKRIEATPAELQSFVQRIDSMNELREGGTKTGPDPRTKEEEAARLEGARPFVTAWKINQSLHAQYGGRVIFQQAGPEPLDAYRDFLREREKAGDFQILDPRCAADFWKYFTDESMHHFLPKESGDQAMRTPWWTLKSCDDAGECPDR